MFRVSQTHSHLIKSGQEKIRKIKQPEAAVIPPNFIWNSYLNLTNETFELDLRDIWPLVHMSEKLHLCFGPATLTLNHLTFDLDHCTYIQLYISCSNGDQCKRPENDAFWYGDLDLWPMILNLRFITTLTCQSQTDGQTDRKWCIRAHHA